MIDPQSLEEIKKNEETLAEIPQSHIFYSKPKQPKVKIPCAPFVYFLVAITIGLSILILGLRESKRGDKVKMYFLLTISAVMLASTFIYFVKYIIEIIFPNLRLFRVLEEDATSKP